jgi:hypothetical protein
MGDCHKETALTHGAEPFLRSRQLCSYSRTSQNFMEPEGSLPCSQEPSTGPYPESDQSNPYHTILSLQTAYQGNVCNYNVPSNTATTNNTLSRTQSN